MSISHADFGIERAAGRAHRSGWYEKLARAGFGAKGALYMIVGVLATRAAVGLGGRTTDQHGALDEIGHSTFGDVLLAIVGVGLAAYALFRLIDAVADPRLRGKGVKGIATRVGRLASGAIHAGLAIAAFKTVTGTPGGHSSEGDLAGRAMAMTGGRFLVGAIGIGVVVFGVQQLVKAWKSDIWEHLERHAMNERMRSFAKVSGRMGSAARGIVFMLTGGFLAHAAATYNPSEARGLKGALETLGSYGSVALGVVAVGLVAYATFCLVRARFYCAAT